MAEKKEHKIVSASTGAQMTKEEAAAANQAADPAAANLAKDLLTWKP